MEQVRYNIISNNCLGGFIYRNILKSEYRNPFIWTLFDDNVFNKFIKNFHTINFRHAVVKKATDNWTIDNDFDTIIANEYIVHNIHMHFNAIHTTPHHCNPASNKNHSLWTDGMSYRYIWEYIYEKYCIRLNRMLMDNIEPIIIYWGMFNGVRCKFEQVRELCEIIHNLQLSAVIFDDRVLQYATKKCIVIPDNKSWVIPRHIIDEHSTNIMRWLNELT